MGKWSPHGFLLRGIPRCAVQYHVVPHKLSEAVERETRDESPTHYPSHPEALHVGHFGNATR